MAGLEDVMKRARFVFGPAAAAALVAFSGQAAGQALQKAAFVANNGNIEGSVTSFTFDAGGAPVFVGKYITGAGSGSPGNNAYAIALTPDGKYLITTHATSAVIVEQISMFQVNADATLTQVGVFQTPDSPLAAAWINDKFLAVTLTNVGGNNKVIVYRFDRGPLTLTEVDRKDTGGFTGYLAVHPSRQYIYTQDSPWSGGNYVIRAFEVGPLGWLTFIGEAHSSPYYALGMSVTNDGRHLYGGGGISGGGNIIVGFDISAQGQLSWMPGSPWFSPGSSPSPKQAVPTPDDRYLFVGHGSSSEVRSFAIDGQTGDLTDTGFAYDVGIQGDLGGIAMLGDWVLFTRKYASTTYGPTGLMSWTVHENGSFTANGPVVSTQGSLPQFIATWNPPVVACYANCDGSTAEPMLNVADFSCFLQKFAAGHEYANCDQSTTEPVLNVADFSCFLVRFAEGCE
jgi:6-phosphogluconolactonase (cycloisomerase 2 family)